MMMILGVQDGHSYLCVVLLTENSLLKSPFSMPRKSPFFYFIFLKW